LQKKKKYQNFRTPAFSMTLTPVQTKLKKSGTYVNKKKTDQELMDYTLRKMERDFLILSNSVNDLYQIIDDNTTDLIP